MATIVLSGPGVARAEVSIHEDGVLIGRDATCDVVVPDRAVSRFHAQIRRVGEGWHLVDLYSTHGVRLNGRPVRQALLSDGDTVEIAGFSLVFRAGQGAIAQAGAGHLDPEAIPGTLADLGYRTQTLSPRTALDDRQDARRVLRGQVEHLAKGATGTDTVIAPGGDVPPELYSLYEISRTITSIWDVRDLMGTVMDKALDVMRADRGFILLVDSATGDLVQRVCRVRGGVAKDEDVVSRRIVRYVAGTGRPTLVADAREDARFGTESVMRAGVRSVLAAPIRRGAAIRGVIYMDRLRDPTPFDRKDLVIFTVFATEAAFAIEASRVYNEFVDGLVDSARDSIITLDLAGNIVTFNRASEESFGWRAEEVRGKSYIDLISTEARGRALEFLKDTVVTGGVPDAELDFIDREGRTIPMSVSSFVFRDAGGEVVGIGGIGRDLTRIKALVHDLAAANEHLREVSRQKSNFVSIVSHELKNPLHVISLATGSLLSGNTGPVTEQQGHFFQIIRRNVEGIYSLVNDLLDLARIEAGRLELALERTDLALAIGSAMDTVNLVADARGVVVERDLPSPPDVGGGAVPPSPATVPAAMTVAVIPLVADPGRLRIIVTNLVSNAVKFTPKGGRVRVAARLDGPNAVLTVEDSGPGIPPEAVATLFDPFRQVPGRAAGVPGTGLGLAIVKGIVLAHGGTVGVETSLGKGARFTVRLPVGGPPRPATTPATTLR